MSQVLINQHTIEHLLKHDLPADLVECLHVYKSEIKNLLDDQLSGIYLHGSIALDAFNCKTSDIDLLILTKSKLNQKTFTKLEYLHKKLNNSFIWANRLECSYITQGTFSSGTQPKENRVYYNKGLKWESYGPEWSLERYLVLTKGICLYGPSLNKITTDNFNQPKNGLKLCVTEIINQTWYPLYNKLPSLADDYIVYGVLSMCRAIHTIESNELFSKQVSAEYVKRKFKEDNTLGYMIDAAMNWSFDLSFDFRKEAIVFIRDTILRHNSPSKSLHAPVSSIYLIRHGHSTYTPDERNRLISEKGRRDVEALSYHLRAVQIDKVYSSPYKRAVQTVEPIADRRNLKIEIVEDLRERKKTEGPLDNFLDQVKWLWDNPSKSLAMGESNESAQRRGVETIEWLRNNNLGQSIAIGSHGDLMALILNYYQPSFDYDFWRHLEMPDTYKLTFEGSRFKSIEHVSKNTLNK